MSYTLPAVEVAVTRMNALYKDTLQIQLHMILSSDAYYSCEAFPDDIVPAVAGYYYNQTVSRCGKSVCFFLGASKCLQKLAQTSTFIQKIAI